MATSRDGLARGLPSDVRAPADIGQVIQLHKPKLWKQIVGLMIGAVASLTILFIIAHFVFSPSGRFGLITPSGNSMSSTFPEGSWALTVPASWVKPQDGSFVVAYYNGDKIPETPQDAKPGLVVKKYNKNQQELVSTDCNDTYPANDIRGVAVAYIPIQKLVRWRDTGMQEAIVKIDPQVHEKLYNQNREKALRKYIASKAELKHRATKISLQQSIISVSKIQRSGSEIESIDYTLGKNYKVVAIVIKGEFRTTISVAIGDEVFDVEGRTPQFEGFVYYTKTQPLVAKIKIKHIRDPKFIPNLIDEIQSVEVWTNKI